MEKDVIEKKEEMIENPNKNQNKVLDNIGFIIAFTIMILFSITGIYLLYNTIYKDVNKLKDTINFENYIIKTNNIKSLENEKEDNVINNKLNIKLENNNFIYSGNIIISKNIDNKQYYISLPIEKDLIFDNSNAVLTSNKIDFQIVKSSEITTEGIGILNSDNDSYINILYKKINEDIGIVGISKNVSKEESEYIKDYMENIYDNIVISEKNNNEVYFLDKKINENFKNFIFCENMIKFSNENESIYISIFNNTLNGAGINQEIKVDDLSFKYSESLKDNETGFVPYFYIKDNITIKILALSNDSLNNLFE